MLTLFGLLHPFKLEACIWFLSSLSESYFSYLNSNTNSMLWVTNQLIQYNHWYWCLQWPRKNAGTRKQHNKNRNWIHWQIAWKKNSDWFIAEHLSNSDQLFPRKVIVSAFQLFGWETVLGADADPPQMCVFGKFLSVCFVLWVNYSICCLF